MLEQDYVDNIILFIKKESHILPLEKQRDSFYFSPNKTCCELGRYSYDEDGDSAVIDTFRKKLEFVFESVFDDNKVIEVAKKYMSENITDIYMSKKRCNRGSNFLIWQKYYCFTIDEFLVDSKYVVVVDSRRNLEELDELGLLNHEKFELTTVGANGWDFKEEK